MQPQGTKGEWGENLESPTQQQTRCPTPQDRRREVGQCDCVGEQTIPRNPPFKRGLDPSLGSPRIRAVKPSVFVRAGQLRSLGVFFFSEILPPNSLTHTRLSILTKSSSSTHRLVM